MAQNPRHHTSRPKLTLKLNAGQEQRVRLNRLSNQPGRLVVWGYGKVRSNSKSDSIPLVEVSFKALEDDLSPGNPYAESYPITWLTHLRIGSVWQRGVYIGDCDWGRRRAFLVRMQDAQLVSLSSSARQDRIARTASNGVPVFGPRTAPSPVSIELPLHELDSQMLRSWFLRFPLPDSRSLFIPCLEFFTSCFGRSYELRRCLTTYPLDEVRDRLYEVPSTPVTPGHWPLKLKRAAQNGDAVFLAHLENDEWTQLVARSIFAQLEAVSSSKVKADRPAVALKVLPWFNGTARLHVEGFPIARAREDGEEQTNADKREARDFLALRVSGCSDPKGPPIELERVQNDPGAPTPPSDEESGGLIFVAPNHPPRQVNLVDDETPDLNAGVTKVFSPEIIVVGQSRIIHVNGKRSGGLRRTNREPGSQTEDASTGPPSGSGKGVRRAKVVTKTKTLFPSEGVLRDVWSTLTAIASAKGCTGPLNVALNNTGQVIISDEMLPWTLLPTQRLGVDETNAYTPNAWDYVKLADGTGKRPRGVLIMQLKREEKSLYVVEVERRGKMAEPVAQATTSSNNLEPTAQYVEESAKGLMFVLDDAQNENPESLFLQLRDLIRSEKGVMGNVVKKFPCESITFMHNTHQDDEMPYQTALLHKMIELKFIHRYGE